MKSSNYVIYLKKRMDMGKCTSCILYIKLNPTTYKETTSFAFLLESILPNPFFQKKNKKKYGHQQSPRFNLPCTSRACS